MRYSTALTSPPLSARNPKFEIPENPPLSVDRSRQKMPQKHSAFDSLFREYFHSDCWSEKIKWIEAGNAQAKSVPVGSKLQAPVRRSNPNPFGD